MSIPKIIYQTWKTKSLHNNCLMIRDNIQRLNPNYQIVLYDDDDIDNFIKNNFDEFTYNCFQQLNVGAAKADFWRYCVLYINGGVYLDIDSDIVRSLDDLIDGDEQCIITREGNLGAFNNWIMIFQKNHPVLLDCIKKCCYNITNKTTNDVCFLTGPHGPFTDAINDVLKPLYNKKIKHLYFEKDTDLNNVLNNKTNDIRCRFYDVDMGSFARFKHAYVNYLYQEHVYWRNEKVIFKSINKCDDK
jgi:mannosyltransferase OCH1-like enzyme